MVSQIRKRDGSIVKFEPEKIQHAIEKAFFEADPKNSKNSKKLTSEVVKAVNSKFENKIPSIEDVQNIVVQVLLKRFKKVADAYSAYRKKKAELRKLRERLGLEKLKLTFNSITVLESRYLLKDESGKIIETPDQMFKRVSKAVAEADKKYKENPKKSYEDFYDMLSHLEFLPNSPTLFNAGAPLKQLSACFVLPIEDSLESIFTAVKNTALIEQSGGGVGFSFSKLRPKGDIVRSTKGVASGPVSFMKVFDVTTDVLKAGGKRRGAMMGVLNYNHPDIIEFVTAKSDGKTLSNFNISVAVNDRFFEILEKNGNIDLVNPRTKSVVGKIKAKNLWKAIGDNAWKTGDPGLLFIDEINRKNPTKNIGEIESSNPCGEQILHPNESCNLGSINLTRMLDGKEINWDKLRETVRRAVHFLDNVIDVNVFPIKEIEKMTKSNRRIGLGVMGFADMLYMMEIPYNSEKAIKIGESLMKFIEEEGLKASIELGLKRGSFPNFKGSMWDGKYKAMRNATVTTIAPTGTISIIAGVSSGIEPIFALSFVRNVLDGKKLLETNSIFEKHAKENGFYSTKLMMEIAKKGSIKNINIPKKFKEVFVTALDIEPIWHVRMQAAFQKHTDNAVSKTVNLPELAKREDVLKIYELAHKLGCKGITVYRYGSKGEQVLNLAGEFITAEADYSGGCPTKVCHI